MTTKSIKQDIRRIDMSPNHITTLIGLGLKRQRVPELEALAKPLVVKTLPKYRFLPEGQSDTGKEPMAICKVRQNEARKQEWLDFLLLFFHPSNFHFYLEALPEKSRNLLCAIAENHAVGMQEAERIYGEKLMDEKFYYRRSNNLGFLNYWLSLDYANQYEGEDYIYDYVVYFSDSSMYELFHQSWTCDIQPVESLPDGLLKFSAERCIFSELPVMDAFYGSKVFSTGRNKLRAASYMKFVSDVPITEFPVGKDVKEKEKPCSRSFFFPLVYALYRDHYVRLSKKPEMLICAIKNFILKDSELFFKLCIPHISGVNRKAIEDIRLQEFLSALVKGLGEHSDQVWMHVDSLCHFMRFRPKDEPYILAEDYFCLMSSYDFNRTHLRNDYTSYPLGYDDLVCQFSKVIVRSLLYVFASLGLLEIAYEPTLPKDAVSPFDALQYVRLTELGRYAFGKTKTYSAPDIEQAVNPFELNEEHLLIKVIDPESPMRMILDSYAKQVGPTLYKVEANDFIRDCQTTGELENKIQQFKNLFGKEVPAVWNDFFDQLLKQSQAFSAAEKSYIIRRIDSQDRRLQEIILTNATLRQYVLRAENYLILIDHDHWTEVQSIFRSYGYML